MSSAPKILSELHNIVLKSLKGDSNIKNCIAGTYDYLPKNPSLPYISMRIADYQEISLIPKFMLKAKLVLGIYSFHMQSLFEIMESAGKVVSSLNFKHLDYKAVLLNNGTAGQHDDVLYALMNFNILLKEKCDKI
ncbi:hypothetical protein [Candidatus Mesenet endosymbiont of Agriotes lineatus]|uniref:hypothetical protein n=1 Tax=Candidatus Mesenet endosymbiont of Agriotes lineatus TaxID=3077948 RepID=UPI0030D170E6